MTQFWTICVAGRINDLNERYYSFEEAKVAAEEKARIDPNTYYLILQLNGYSKGNYVINVDSEILEENIILPQNQYSIVGVTFTYNDGIYMDLSNCEIELLVLPSRNSSDDEAIYDVIIDGYAGLKEVEYTFEPEVTADIFNGWYKINIIRNEISKTYQEGAFLII